MAENQEIENQDIIDFTEEHCFYDNGTLVVNYNDALIFSGSFKSDFSRNFGNRVREIKVEIDRRATKIDQSFFDQLRSLSQHYTKLTLISDNCYSTKINLLHYTNIIELSISFSGPEYLRNDDYFMIDEKYFKFCEKLLLDGISLNSSQCMSLLTNQNLVELSLYFIKLEGDLILRNPNLKMLHLFGIIQSNIKLIRCHSKITTLKVYHCTFFRWQNFNPQFIEYLNIERCNLTRVPGPSILPNLRYLILPVNRLTHLELYPNLLVFDLEYNPLDHTTLALYPPTPDAIDNHEFDDLGISNIVHTEDNQIEQQHIINNVCRDIEDIITQEEFQKEHTISVIVVNNTSSKASHSIALCFDTSRLSRWSTINNFFLMNGEEVFKLPEGQMIRVKEFRSKLRKYKAFYLEKAGSSKYKTIEYTYYNIQPFHRRQLIEYFASFVKKANSASSSNTHESDLFSEERVAARLPPIESLDTNLDLSDLW